MIISYAYNICSAFVAGLCKDSKESKHHIMYNNSDQPITMGWPLQVSTANAEIHGAQVQRLLILSWEVKSDICKKDPCGIVYHFIRPADFPLTFHDSNDFPIHTPKRWTQFHLPEVPLQPSWALSAVWWHGATTWLVETVRRCRSSYGRLGRGGRPGVGNVGQAS